ncbi:MAG TPA: hypothetical protein VFK90_06630, partial [Anaeromyxobacter sp.]|nr:hypothetical protein [Anaeromyxobacter sp.]
MPPRLGDLLVQEHACTPQALRDALQNQVIFGGRLGTNLLELRAVSEEALARALGRQHALPSLFGEMRLDPNATALLRPEIADRWDAVPYVVADRRLALLVVDPRDLAMLDEVAFATGKQVHPIVVPEARVWALLRETYGLERNLRGIEVAFAGLAPRVSGQAPKPAEPPSAGDLMEEDEFQALYGKVWDASAQRPPAPPAAPALPARPAPAAPPAASPAPPAPAAPPDDVIELTDLLQPQPEAPPPAADVPAQVMAALSSAPGHAPPARLVRSAAPSEPEPSPLGFDEAIRFLGVVKERDSIARVVLRYARSRFRRAVLLTVQRGAAHGWAGL